MNFKNFKAYKKLIALLNAGIMVATPVIGNTEEVKKETKNDTEIVQVTNSQDLFGGLVVIEQEKFAEPISTLEQFNNNVNKVCNYIVQFIDYQGNLKDFKRDIQCLYYLTNREHITSELEKELISSHAINEVTQDDWSTLVFAIEGKNIIDEYNQSVIKNLSNIINIERIKYEEFDQEMLNKYLKKVINTKDYTIINAIYDYSQEMKNIDETKVIELGEMCLSYDVRLNEYLESVISGELDLLEAIELYNNMLIKETKESLIDVSEICYDKHDKALLHDMHENYVTAYQTGRFMNFDRTELNESYVKVFKQLTTLNAMENDGNAFEVSMGARWLAQQSIGNNVMQMLRDDMQENYRREELDRYFDKELLNQAQWWMREDVSINLNCPTDLELEVFNFGQLWWFCYDTVNLEMFQSFGVILEDAKEVQKTKTRTFA